MPGVFVACGASDCRWNQDGQCKRSDVFVDRGAMCTTYEPETATLPMEPIGGPRAALREMLAGGVGGGAPPVTVRHASGPPGGLPLPVGRPPAVL